MLFRSLLSNLLVGKGGFDNTEPPSTAQSIRPINNTGGSSSAQEMHRSARQSLDFILNAFLSFGYSRRAFNGLYLWNCFNSTVCFDEVEKWNRRVCVCRFLWRSEPIKCPPLHPLYKMERRRLLFFVKSPFSSFWDFKYLASLRVYFTHWFIH